jgi:hypothetical protein
MKFVLNLTMKKLLTVFFVLNVFVTLSGQVNKGAKFNKLLHHFGDIKEESGPVSTIFSFKNISGKPIRIVKVETSCGCTKPEYSKDSIMPGDTGFVRAIYDTRGREGEFYKNLFVHFSDESYYQSLAIKGKVIPEANLLSKPAEYTTTYSNLAFTSTVAYFPDIKNTEKKDYVIKIFNYMGYPIRIYEIKNKPDYALVDLGDSVIGVEDSLRVTITVDGRLMTQFGDQTSPISLLTDDPNAETKFLYIRANLKEDFSKMSGKSLKNAPKIQLDSAGPFNFGKRSSGAKFKHTIKVTNTGKKPLNIRKVVTSCSCVAFNMGKQELQPGESADLVLTIDTLNQIKADLIKYLTIVSNDPANPEIKIKLMFTVTN